MKISGIPSLSRPRAWFIIICLCVAGLSIPFDGFSETQITAQTGSNTVSNDLSSRSAVTKDQPEIQELTRDSSPTSNTHAKSKKILIDDARDFSVFFMIGIAINIIMATTFAWWFTKEWRRSKK